MTAAEGDMKFDLLMKFIAEYTPEHNVMGADVQAELLQMTRGYLELEEELETAEEFVEFMLEGHKKDLEKYS